MSSSDRDCPSSIVSASEFARRRAFLGSFDPFSFKENLETLFAHLSEAVLLIDAQGRILAANNAACRLFQMTQQELGQQHLPALCQLEVHPTNQLLSFPIQQSCQGYLTPLQSVATTARYPFGLLAEVSPAVHWLVVPLTFPGAALADAQGTAAPLPPAIAGTKAAQADTADQLYLQNVALNACADVILITDRRGIIEWVNPAFTQLTGYTPAEAVGRNPRELVNSGEQEQAFFQQLWQTILAGQVWRGEVVNRRKDHTQYVEEMTITPVYNGTQEITHFIAVKQDITDRKAAEKRQQALNAQINIYAQALEQVNLALRLSDQRYRSIVDTQTELICRFTPAGVLTFVNGAYCRFFDRPLTALIGQSFLALVPPEQQAEVQQQIAALQQLTVDRAVMIHEHSSVLPTGQVAWHQWINQGVFDERGQLIEIQASGRDITEFKLAEQALRDREHHLDLFFTQSLDGFFFMMLDEPIEWHDAIDKEAALDYVFAHQRVTKANQAFLEQYGFNEADFLGRTPNEFFAHDLIAGRAVWRQFFDEGRLHVDTSEKRVDGTPIWIEGDYICLYDEQGCITGHFGVQRDVTSLRHAIHALAESEQQYRHLVENQSDLVVKIDVDGHFLFVSPSYCEFFGQTAEALLSKDFTPLVHPDDRDATLTAMAALWQPPHTCWIEQRVLTHRGWRWIAWADTAVVDEAGNVTAIVGIGRDITERKQMEQALQLSEQRFRNVLETLTMVAIMLDAQGNILFCNDYLLSLTGWQREEVIGRSWADLFLPDEIRLPLLAILAQMVAGQDFPTYYENEIVTRGGDRRLIAWNNTVQHDTQGEISGITSIGEDITDRKRQETQIVELSQRLSLATRSAQIGVWQLDYTTGEVTWDERMYEIYGVTSSIAFATWLATCVHPEDAETIQQSEAALRQGAEHTQLEFRAVRPDGSMRYIEAHTTAVRDAEGGLQRLIGLNRDISDRRRHEAILQETTQRLTLATEAAQLGIWEWDIASDRTLWDQRMHEIYGTTPETYSGLHADWIKTIHPDDLSLMEREGFALNQGEDGFRSEFRILRPTGEVRHIESYGYFIRDADGQVVRVVGVNEDISDRKQSEQALAEAHDLLTALLQNSPAIIELYDETGRYQKINSITSDFLGLPPEAIEGRRFDEIHTPEVAALFMARIRQLVATNQPMVVEDRLRRRGDDGEDRILQSVLFPVLTRPNAPNLLGLIATDITELVTAQDHLRQQAEREHLLREITGNIRRSLDLETILDSTVTGIREFLATDRVLIYQFNPDWSGDITVESVGADWLVVLDSTLRDPCFAEKWIEPYRQGHTHQIDDIETAAIAPCYRDFLRSYQVRANLVMPLVVNEQLWGLLCIHHCQAPRHWQTEEIDFVRQLADQVAIAIQQAHLLAAEKIRAQRETLRRRITQDIRRSLDLETILATTAHEVCVFLQADRVLINRLNPEQEAQIIVQSTEPGRPRIADHSLRQPCFAPSQYEQFRQGQHLQIDDMQAQCHQPYLSQYDILAMLTFPLTIEGQLWGVMCIHHCRSPRQWQPDEITFVQQITEQVEIAIQQALLLHQTKIQVQREQILNEIISDIRDSLDLQKILERTTQKLLETFEVGRCIISLCDQDDNYLEYLATASRPGIASLRGLRVPIKDNHFVQQVLSQASPVATSNVITEPSLQGEATLFFQKFNISAMLAVAIRHEHQVKGILCVQNPVPRHWTEDERTLIKQVANQLAIAIQQAELYQQAQAEIRQRQRLEQQLRYDALHDTLTGLPNRALFLERLQLALQRYQRRQQQTAIAADVTLAPAAFAILFLDLDRFKIINDSLGHSFGDQLLKLVADRLTDCLREIDIAARLGGDEFVILLEELTDLQFAIDIAHRIHSILEVPIFLDEREVFIRASIGITFGTSYYNTPEQILRDADIAMYEAKKNNQEYVVFDASMHAIALEQMNLENDLRHAIKKGELRLYFQPIVTLSTGKIAGFEALVRWQHPTRGLLYPDAFVNVAEDTGLIAAIDLWVLQQACQQLNAWHQLSPEFADLTISVNLSGKQFSQPNLIKQIDTILASAHLNGRYLKLEITESILITNSSLAVQTLNEFRARNIQVCMDDFGTGYSSLSYLHQFPVDILKVDKSFILNLNSPKATPRDYEIVKAIIHLALNLNLAVVAEGVENHDVLVYLQKNNCQFGQGYHFAPAIAPDAATQLLLGPPFS